MSFGVAVPGRRIRDRNRRTDSNGKWTEGRLSSSVARLILLLLVVSCPWALGGVFASVQVMLFTAVLVALFCWLTAFASGRSAHVVLPLLLVPLACALLMGLAQLRPLPAGLCRTLSPAGAAIRSAYIGSGSLTGSRTLVDATSVTGSEAQFPISLDPAATRRDLSLLVLAVAVFMLGLRYFKTTRALLTLCSVIAVNGAAISFFGIVQRLTWNGKLFWTMPLTSGGSPFGPFVNRNNSGGFLTLCLAGAVGLLVWTTTRAAARRYQGGLDFLHDSEGGLRGVRASAVAILANLDAAQVGVLVLMVCIVAGILCSLSRGAFVAMTGGALVTALAAAVVHRRLTAIWLLSAGGVLALGLVAWAGMTPAVGSRLGTIVERNRPESRLVHWRDALRAAGDYWLLGSGLGTYSGVYRPYQQAHDPLRHDHAENQLIEALVTGGILALGLLISAVVLAAVAAVRLLTFEASKPGHAFALMGIFALSAQFIHGMFDFGLFIPSNTLLFALLMGAVVGRAALLAEERRAIAWIALPRLKKLPLAPMVLLVLFLGVFLGRFETRLAAAVESSTPPQRLPKDESRASVRQVDAQADRLAAALRNRPDDGEGQLRLAELYIQLFRLRAVETVREEQSQQGIEADAATIWPYTSSAQLHYQAHRLKEAGAGLDDLRSRILMQQDLSRAIDHLLLARAASPLLARTYVRLAELCFLVEDDLDVDEVHLACAKRLDPGNAALLFHLGILHLGAGRKAQALANWQACLQLTGDFDDQVLRAAMASGRIGLDELQGVLPASPERLLRLASGKQLPPDSAERQLLVSKAEQSIDSVEMPEGELFHLRGALQAMRSDYEAAVESYKNAVAREGRNVEWRYELAEILTTLGRYDEAQEQAEICVRWQADVPKYKHLLLKIVELKYPVKSGRR